MSTHFDLATYPCAKLSGVGARTAEHLAKLNIVSVQDLLFHLPYRYLDRTKITPLRQLRVGQHVVVEGTVVQVEVKKSRRTMLLCHIQDAYGSLIVRFFHFTAQQKKQLETPDVKLRCYGEIRWGMTGLEMIHPEYKILSNDKLDLPVEKYLTPIYSSTEGLTQTTLRKLQKQALELMMQSINFDEHLPDEIRVQFKWPNLKESLRLIHQPPPDISCEILENYQHPAQQRLIFEELLAHRLCLHQLRQQITQQAAIPFKIEQSLIAKFIANLSFQLTSAQKRVTEEIAKDLMSDKPMLRLVQGDVGSGKTVVAAYALLCAVSSGVQGCLMAPTELLAEQHRINFTKWLTPLGIQVAWLSGEQNAPERQRNLALISSGEAQIIVGTHALFQQNVLFANLGLLVVDEQHRFGVEQRLALRDKGVNHNYMPHQLIMTATPIPRSLAMTHYADLDCSIIDELPAGRIPIKTSLISQNRRSEVVQKIYEMCKNGQQAYWICTLIDESELLTCQAAETTAAKLKELLPEINVALVHGRMKAHEKDAIMNLFRTGKVHLLVATTVIEVGVDVPNANVIVIENPERLGLAQLHQLRGRVGRGQAQAYCILLYKSPLGEVARQRLSVLRDCADGFKIAEHDLAIRGPGEILGTKQTGALQFRVANLIRDAKLLTEVPTISEFLLHQFPALAKKIKERWFNVRINFGQV